MKEKTEEILLERIEALEERLQRHEDEMACRTGVFHELDETHARRMDVVDEEEPSTAAFEGKHFVRQSLPGCVTALLLDNMNIYEMTLLPDGPLPPPAEGVRLALFIVTPKDEMGVAWQAPMSIAPLWGYPHLAYQDAIDVVIGKALYTLNKLDPIDVEKVEEGWGETVAGRARTDVPCVCFRMDLKDASKDYSQEIAAAKAEIEAFWARHRL